MVKCVYKFCDGERVKCSFKFCDGEMVKFYFPFFCVEMVKCFFKPIGVKYKVGLLKIFNLFHSFKLIFKI